MVFDDFVGLETYAEAVLERRRQARAKRTRIPTATPARDYDELLRSAASRRSERSTENVHKANIEASHVKRSALSQKPRKTRKDYMDRRRVSSAEARTLISQEENRRRLARLKQVRAKDVAVAERLRNRRRLELEKASEEVETSIRSDWKVARAQRLKTAQDAVDREAGESVFRSQKEAESVLRIAEAERALRKAKAEPVVEPVVVERRPPLVSSESTMKADFERVFGVSESALSDETPKVSIVVSDDDDDSYPPRSNADDDDDDDDNDSDEINVRYDYELLKRLDSPVEKLNTVAEELLADALAETEDVLEAEEGSANEETLKAIHEPMENSVWNDDTEWDAEREAPFHKTMMGGTSFTVDDDFEDLVLEEERKSPIKGVDGVARSAGGEAFVVGDDRVDSRAVEELRRRSELRAVKHHHEEQHSYPYAKIEAAAAAVAVDKGVVGVVRRKIDSREAKSRTRRNYLNLPEVMEERRRETEAAEAAARRLAVKRADAERRAALRS